MYDQNCCTAAYTKSYTTSAEKRVWVSSGCFFSEVYCKMNENVEPCVCVKNWETWKIKNSWKIRWKKMHLRYCCPLSYVQECPCFAERWLRVEVGPWLSQQPAYGSSTAVAASHLKRTDLTMEQSRFTHGRNTATANVQSSRLVSLSNLWTMRWEQCVQGQQAASRWWEREVRQGQGGERGTQTKAPQITHNMHGWDREREVILPHLHLPRAPRSLLLPLLVISWASTLKIRSPHWGLVQLDKQSSWAVLLQQQGLPVVDN